MLPGSVRIFVCTEPQDMRRSFDAPALATAQLLGQDPRSGALFVFINKRSTRAKVLWWDTNGYCLLYKRLHQALFVLPSAPACQSQSAQAGRYRTSCQRRVNGCYLFPGARQHCRRDPGCNLPRWSAHGRQKSPDKGIGSPAKNAAPPGRFGIRAGIE
jgi:transposase